MAQRIGKIVLVTLAALGVCAQLAVAGESVQTSITIPAGQPDPLITVNGNPYSTGTYAVGTLRLEYNYVGFAFPAGPFAQFALGLSTVQAGGAATNYPAALNLVQTGSADVDLVANPAAFTIAGYPWSSSSELTISIPDSVANDPDLAADGTVIVGNLQLTTNHGSKLGTTTTVQIKIRLVHPTACLRQFTFFSDRDISDAYSTLTISYGTKPGNLNKILNTSQVSANAAAQVVLIVNTCSQDYTVDLRVVPDARFDFGSGNGNTTFVYSTTGELSPGAIDTATLTAVNQYAHVLDITNLGIPAGKSVLVQVNLVLDDSLNATTIGTSPFTFASAAYVPDGTFTTADPDVDPNPAIGTVNFTLVPQN